MAIPAVLQSHAKPFLKQGRSAAAHGKGFSTWIQLHRKAGIRDTWLGICIWVLQQLLPSSKDRKEVQLRGWVGTNNIKERREALGSTEKEIILKCGHSYRLQKCHTSVHFYDFFAPSWAQLHKQGQPLLIYFKLTQHQPQVPYCTKLFSLSYLPQMIKLNKWMNIIHSLVYEPEAPQRQ